jgi:signal transduction histidine kinase
LWKNLNQIIRLPRDSLQFRVAFSLALFVAFAISVMMLTLFTVNTRIQNDLLNSVVAHEMGELVDEYPDDGAEAIPHSAELTGYVIGPGESGRLPKALRRLGPNVSGLTLSFNDHTYRVATHPIGDKQGYIIYNITTIKNREARLKLVAAIAALLILALAVPLGIWIARISLKPINALAEQVAELDPGHHATRLAQRFERYEVGTIARAFDRFMGRLEEFVERERSFTADASHELRTPLAVIQGAVEVLQQDARLVASGPVDRIDRAAHQMADLIETLLFLARDEQPDEGRSPACRADQVITEAVEAYRPLMLSKRIEIDRLERCEINAPRTALVIIVNNLLRNALRHGGDTIRVSLAKQRLTVADNGPGMDSEALQRVFERGYHAGQGAGLGLGLYLVKRVADRYHWQIRLTSRAGEGTRAELQLA